MIAPLLTALALAPAASAQHVGTMGDCPGPVLIDVADITPGGDYTLFSGNGAGTDVLPAGPCAGTATGLSGLTMRMSGSADGIGAAALGPVDLPAGACGAWLQVLDSTTCELSPIAPVAETCEYPDVTLPSGGGGGTPVTPNYVGVNMAAIVEGDTLNDFTTVSPSSEDDMPAVVEFTFMDLSFFTVCTVTYDAATLMATDTYPPPSVDPLAVWDVFLAGGATDCPDLYDVGTGYATDPFDYIEANIWQFGLAPMNYGSGGIGSMFRDAVIDSGEDYDTNWAPYVFSHLVGLGGGPLFEMGYSFGYDQTCGDVNVDDFGFVNPADMQAAPLEGDSLDAFVSAQNWIVFGTGLDY